MRRFFRSFPSPSLRVAYTLLAAMMLAYVIGYGAVALRLHAAFVTAADDLSNVDQVAWNSQNGRLLERTTGTRSVPRYGEHVEPIWVALGLLYRGWDDVRALLLAQTVALAAGALPVFWLARDVWGRVRAPTGKDEVAGLVFAAVYLLSPFVGRANVAEVHALPFAVAPLLLAVTWAWQGRWRRVAPLVVLVLLVREDAGLLVAALGLWAWVAQRAWRAGMVLIAAGGAAVGVMLFGIIPRFADERFSGQTGSIFWERYSAFGEGPAGVLVGMLTRPAVWVELGRDPWRLEFVRDLVGSTGGLAFLSPASWLLLAPHLVLNVPSDYFAQVGGLQHYGAPLVPGLMVAAVLGGARLLRWGGGRPVWRAALLALALGGALVTARLADGQPLARTWIAPPVTPHHRLLAEIVAPIPPLAPISVDPQLHPHLAHRPDAYRFPRLGDNTEWVLADVTTNTSRHPADLRRDLLARLAEGWGVADARDGYVLLARDAMATTLPPVFFSFAHPAAPPEVALPARLGESIEVLGYDVGQDFWGRVTVTWHLRPLQPLPPTLVLETALLGPDGAPQPDTTAQPSVLLTWLPPDQWRAGETYALRTLPREVEPPFQPALHVRDGDVLLPVTWLLSDGDARGETIGAWLAGGAWELAHNHVRRVERGWRRWVPPAPVAAEPGAWPVARLGAWEITEREDSATVTLHWQATMDEAPPTQRFVHLVPAEGAPRPLAQADGPLGGDYPVSRWATGEWVTETVTLDMPPDAGPWRLLVGLYDPITGERLPVAPDEGSGAFELQREG